MSRRTNKQDEQAELINSQAAQIDSLVEAAEIRETEWNTQAARYRQQIRRLRLELTTAQAEAEGLRLALRHVGRNSPESLPPPLVRNLRPVENNIH